MAADTEVAEDAGEENILYHLTIHGEWPQERETIHRVTREKSQVSLTGRLASTASRTTWTFLRSVGVPVKSGSPCSLPAPLVKLTTGQMNWHFDVTQDGHFVAILQDQTIEIRSARDDFSSDIFKWTIPKDPHPQWRHICWSPDGNLVAWSDSSGSVQVCDLMGTIICTLPQTAPSKPNAPSDLSNALCAVIFKEHKGDSKWVTDLLLITYQGTLKCYRISLEGEYQLHHTFHFMSQYPRGVSTAVYHPKHSLLVLGGGGSPPEAKAGEQPTALQCGVTAWRVLSDIPHYKLVTDYEQDLSSSHSRRQFMKRLKSIRSGWYGEEAPDGIYKLILSPDGSTVAAIHFSGRLTLLEVPSLRMKHSWPEEDQPGFDEVNQEIASNPKKRKQMKDHLTAFYLTAANWWSEQAVILARGTGALTVSSVKSLKNLLGNAPEWLEPAPLLSMAHDGGFLGLECECRSSILKRPLTEGSDDEYEDSDDEDDATVVMKSTKFVKQVLYYVTDSERFQPPRKRPKLITRTYRLIYLKSTTPEELYARKIDSEEYGEALVLAKAYGLDCDLVYQRQWRKTPVSVASIQDYLSKISKRSWVLHECLERVPENIDAMRELLQYGLRGTDLEALISIGKGEDGGRFILCDRHDVYDESIDEFDTEALEEAKERERKRKQDLVDQVDFSTLTLEQKEVCRARVKLLQYLDRLATYEEILGGMHKAEERFDYKYFENFRSQNMVELAVDYARAGDWRALDTIFTYHGRTTLPHRLSILSNFPETQCPSEYQELLPEAGSDTDEQVLPWRQDAWRDEDWSELAECQKVIDPNPVDLGAFLYEDNTNYERFRGPDLTRSQLTEWYLQRACEIEEFSRLVEFSLVLVRLAMERNVEGLDLLHDDLVTMETMVYECHIDEDLGFADIQEMPTIDQLRLMMSRSSQEMYTKNLHRWLIPFLHRCDRRADGDFNSLLREYMLTMARTDLTLCLKVFESSKASERNPVIGNEQFLMNLALDCIYACESNDQLSNGFGILECLPQRGFGVVTESSTNLHNDVDQLEYHLSAAEILENNNLAVTVSFIRDTQDDPEEAKKLFVKLTRVAGRKEPSLTEKQWNELLTSLLKLRDKAYRCVESNVCYEIFVQSLLCSGRPQNIQLAAKRIEQSSEEASMSQHSKEWDRRGHSFKVNYDRALELVLSASMEYFNSAANLTDSSMELARLCLALIVDSPSQILEELDLIESLAFLEGFGVSTLPVQVRMCKDRLELINQAIDAKPFTYKNSPRLLKLGRLLRVAGANENEREGQILQLVAQAALKAKDYKVAHNTCCRLMEASYPPIWAECKQLAETELFQDIKAKSDLLSYSVTHCSADMIEPILQAHCLLETQILYEKVHNQMSDRGSGGGHHSSSQSPTESPFSPRGAIQQTKEILSSTNKATKAVLSTVSDRAWWQKTLKSLRPVQRDQTVDDLDDLNATFQKQGCHPFYEDVIDNCYCNKSEVDYARYQGSRAQLGGLNFSEGVYRAGKLEETLTEGETSHPNAEVLLQMAQDSIAQDATLGLAYLLALPEALDADKCFDNNLSTAVSLQLATYYYALQLYTQLRPNSEPCQKVVYSYPPMELACRMLAHIDHMTKMGRAEWAESVGALIDRLKHYNEMLTDYTQAQVLQGLDRGIDIGRFTTDPEYKRETILGLAMCLEQSVYETAVTLANRYHVPMFEVYLAHLEFLFDSGVSTDEIEQRVNQLNILTTLRSQPADFHARMQTYVFPGIEGTDHDRLLYYYTLLEGCGTDGGASVETHLRMMKKIKASAPGLDYKKLTDSRHRPLDVVRPILTVENINTVAKLAAKIPDQHGGYLQPSVVYCAWALKVFWEGVQPGKKIPQTTADWVHRYEGCGEYLQKLLPEDVIHFIDGITFVPQALDELNVDIRHKVLKRALKYSRQQVGGKKKKMDETGTKTWAEVAEHLQQSINHLDLVQLDAVVDLFAPVRDGDDAAADDSTMQRYAREFELTRSEPEKVQALLVKMVLDGQPPETIEGILDATTTVQKWTTQSAVRDALGIITSAIRGEETTVCLPSDEDHMTVLRRVITVVGKHQEEGGDLVSQDDVMGLLRPFCADQAISVDLRLEVLKILEQCFKLSDEDLVLLILYRTEAIVSLSWTNTELTEDKISTDSGRQDLFKTLLEKSEQLDQFLSLSSLLHVWPPLEAITSSEEDLDSNPWCQLVSKLVNSSTDVQTVAPSVVTLVQDLQKSPQALSEQCLRAVHEVVKTAGSPVAAVKCLLLGNHVSLHDYAVEKLQQHEETSDDEELLRLILQRHLASSIVTSPYYPKVIEYVLANQGPAEEVPYFLRMDTIANQLQEAGYDAEAGSLMLQQRGTHPVLRTYDVAVGMLSRWFHR